MKNVNGKKQEARGRLLLFITSLFLLLASNLHAQFQDSVDVVIDSLGTSSSVGDMKHFKLISIEFPATVSSDTVFIKTASDTVGGGTFRDVYYTSGDGTRTRLHILVKASAFVGVPPVWAVELKRYIKIIPDDAEADTRTFGLNFGSW